MNDTATLTPADEETALVPSSPVPAPTDTASRALALRTMAEYLAFGQLCVESGLALGHKNAASVTIAVQFGAELGLSPMQSLRNVHLIDGRPSLSADALVAVAQAHPACRYFRKLEETAERATWETFRKGHQEPTRYTFTIEDAQRAKLAGKSNWQTYPARLLSARAKSFLARDVYPDRLAGLLSFEEAVDIDDLTPAAVVIASPQRISAEAATPPAEVVTTASTDEVVTTDALPPEPVHEESAAPAASAQSGEPMISDPQRRRMYALWKQAQHDDATVRTWLQVTHGIDDGRQVPKRLYEVICKRLQDPTPLDVVDPNDPDAHIGLEG